MGINYLKDGQSCSDVIQGFVDRCSELENTQIPHWEASAKVQTRNLLAAKANSAKHQSCWAFQQFSAFFSD